jgi:hypothetical protein
VSLTTQGKYRLMLFLPARCLCQLFLKKALLGTTLYETMDIHRLQGKKDGRKRKAVNDGLSDEDSADQQAEGKSVVREFSQRTG